MNQSAPDQPQPNNPLHGVTLKAMLEYLVAEYGWYRLGERINIHCFNYEPTNNSSLKFLRKTDWAHAVNLILHRLLSVGARSNFDAGGDSRSTHFVNTFVATLHRGKDFVPVALDVRAVFDR